MSFGVRGPRFCETESQTKMHRYDYCGRNLSTKWCGVEDHRSLHVLTLVCVCPQVYKCTYRCFIAYNMWMHRRYPAAAICGCRCDPNSFVWKHVMHEEGREGLAREGDGQRETGVEGEVEMTVRRGQRAGRVQIVIRRRFPRLGPWCLVGSLPQASYYLLDSVCRLRPLPRSFGATSAPRAFLNTLF